MGKQNPLRNRGTDEFIKFAVAHGYVRGRVKGDDVVYYNPENRTKYIKITLNKKGGTPLPTVYSMIRTSGIAKQEWWNGFDQKC